MIPVYKQFYYFFKKIYIFVIFVSWLLETR